MSSAFRSQAETPADQVAQECNDLGVTRPRSLALPDATCLPLVCRTDGRGWGVVLGRTPVGLWVTRYASGEAHVTALTLHDACCAAAVSGPDGHSPERSRQRTGLLSGMVCSPMLAGGWQSVSTAVLVLLALLLGVRLIRWLGRKWMRGRRPLLASWTEDMRLARQRDRILRQAIRSGTSAAADRPAPIPRNAMRST